jgi:hypothetical protein
MRTTVDIPNDLHRQVAGIAHDRARTFSETVVELMRRGLEQPAPAGAAGTSQRTQLPLVHVGRVVTTDDVRELEDEV